MKKYIIYAEQFNGNHFEDRIVSVTDDEEEAEKIRSILTDSWYEVIDDDINEAILSFDQQYLCLWDGQDDCIEIFWLSDDSIKEFIDKFSENTYRRLLYNGIQSIRLNYKSVEEKATIVKAGNRIEAIKKACAIFGISYVERYYD